MTRKLIQIVILFGVLHGICGYSQGVFNGWFVTHDKKLVAIVTPLESQRAYLESRLAAERGIESATWTSTMGTEAYSALRSYATFLRTLRNLQRVREGIMLMKLPVWTMLPRIGFVAPVAYKDENGKNLVMEKEIASLSVVPPAYQAHWNSADFVQDDETMGAADIRPAGKPLIKFDYPHKLSDVQLTFSPSPFLSDYAYDESQAIDDMKAHFFEAIMDSASRLAGFGIQVNPQILADGSVLVEGRMSPAQLRLQATLLEQQAMTTIDKLRRLYIDHGTSMDVVNHMFQRDTEYWDGFGTKMGVAGSARIMFAMNLMNEIHQTIGRLEAYQRRNKIAETDEAMVHLGKKKDPDGQWSGFLEKSSNFWDLVDNLAGMKNGGKAIILQAEGLSARYSRFQFDEAEGWRNVLMGSERMKIALQGVRNQEKQEEELTKMVASDKVYDMLNFYQMRRQDITDYLNTSTWGGLKDVYLKPFGPDA